MYTIIVNDDNTLVRSKIETIMQRSTNVNYLHFLCAPKYNTNNGEVDMSTFSCTLEYKLPISKEYHTEALVMTDGLYKDSYLEQKLPIDTSFTKEVGNIELQLTFIDIQTNTDGTTTQLVRKTQPTTVAISAIAPWADTVPDAALTAIDQRLIAVSQLIEQLNTTINQMNANAVAGLKLDGNTLYLVKADGSYIGNGVTIQGTIITETTGDMKVVSI